MRESTVIVQRDVLESWLKVSGYTKTRLAQELNVSKGRVSQILRFDAEEEPSARLIAGLLDVTKLPFDRLFTVKERRAMQRRLAQMTQRRRLQRAKRAGASS